MKIYIELTEETDHKKHKHTFESDMAEMSNKKILDAIDFLKFKMANSITPKPKKKK